jgi:hypothetical protein
VKASEKVQAIMEGKIRRVTKARAIYDHQMESLGVLSVTCLERRQPEARRDSIQGSWRDQMAQKVSKKQANAQSQDQCGELSQDTAADEWDRAIREAIRIADQQLIEMEKQEYKIEYDNLVILRSMGRD